MKYPEGESALVELKAQVPAKQQIVKTIVAFCNGFGGKLIIGVQDDRAICGVEEDDIDELMTSLQQSIYQSATPAILPSIYTQRIQEKLLVIIEVSAGMNKPYFVTALGLNEGVFIRAGAQTVKATSQLIQELAWQSKGFSADEMPVYAASKETIDTSLFRSHLERYRQFYQQGDLSAQLRHYKVLIEEHQHVYPTVGGLLLFGDQPERYLPEAFVICTHFKGVFGREALASQDCTGNLLMQATSALHFVTSRLHRAFHIQGAQRHEALEVPEVALREVIINAVVHRDYHLPGPIKIAIYDDRVEVFSPGNFPGPLRTDQLEMGITYIRNHVICRVFREAGFIEKLGSGFLTLFDSYRKAGLPQPKVIEGSGFIKCILPRADKVNTRMTVDSYEKIRQLFYVSDELTAEEVVRSLGVSRQTAGRRLAELVKQGFLIRVGKGPATRYKIRENRV